MQNVDEMAAILVQQNSPGAMLARVSARSKGMPVPFVGASVATQMQEMKGDQKLACLGLACGSTLLGGLSLMSMKLLRYAPR
eukprot:CAMPEP_0169084080 /NCGR_PEP_ID=MMETSP1015-20121227/12427_1 /TAXON_ID=342587 /ORGANISM="Karlodinium micrum, Strain CCMP2283" /LENGTH=81 /DNA_ID=CAMNT_0009144059 /DNA_START=79 /DNA_END=324 /DNA_ORIENTATION=+